MSTIGGDAAGGNALASVTGEAVNGVGVSETIASASDAILSGDALAGASDAIVGAASDTLAAAGGVVGDLAFGGFAGFAVWKYVASGGAMAVVSELLFAAFCIYLAAQTSKQESNESMKIENVPGSTEIDDVVVESVAREVSASLEVSSTTVEREQTIKGDTKMDESNGNV
jgi:hypothetical protein